MHGSQLSTLGWTILAPLKKALRMQEASEPRDITKFFGSSLSTTRLTRPGLVLNDKNPQI
jgi:hypothetical protein